MTQRYLCERRLWRKRKEQESNQRRREVDEAVRRSRGDRREV